MASVSWAPGNYWGLMLQFCFATVSCEWSHTGAVFLRPVAFPQHLRSLSLSSPVWDWVVHHCLEAPACWSIHRFLEIINIPFCFYFFGANTRIRIAGSDYKCLKCLISINSYHCLMSSRTFFIPAKTMNLLLPWVHTRLIFLHCWIKFVVVSHKKFTHSSVVHLSPNVITPITPYAIASF